MVKIMKNMNNNINNTTNEIDYGKDKNKQTRIVGFLIIVIIIIMMRLPTLKQDNTNDKILSTIISGVK